MLFELVGQEDVVGLDDGIVIEFFFRGGNFLLLVIVD